MLLLKRFENDGDELNVAVPDLVRHLVSGAAAVPPADAPGLLSLHIVLQLPVGGMHLLQQLSPAQRSQAICTGVPAVNDRICC